MSCEHACEDFLFPEVTLEAFYWLGFVMVSRGLEGLFMNHHRPFFFCFWWVFWSRWHGSSRVHCRPFVFVKQKTVLTDLWIPTTSHILGKDRAVHMVTCMHALPHVVTGMAKQQWHATRAGKTSRACLLHRGITEWRCWWTPSVATCGIIAYRTLSWPCQGILCWPPNLPIRP